MPRQTLEIDAKVGAAVAELMKVVSAQGKLEQGFKRVAQSGTNGMRQVEREIARLDAASLRASRSLVAGVRRGSGGGGLSLTQLQRAELRGSSMYAAPGTDLRAIQDVALQRRLVAEGLRRQRASAYALQHSVMMRGAVDSAMTGIRADRAANLSRQGAAMANAGAMSFFAGGGRMFDDDAIMRRARRDVARNVAGTPELRGKVSSEEFDTMTSVRAGAIRRQQELRNRVATGAMYVGTALTGLAYAAEQELNRYGDTIVGFEDQMAPLYGVGGNMRNRPRLRRDVLAASTGYGISSEQIAGMKFNLQSAAADLPAQTQAAIEQTSLQFYQLQRTNMQEMSKAMVGMLQVAGPDVAPGAAGVRQLASKLGAAADIGSFEIEQYAPYLASTLGAFKATGFSQDDAFAAMAAASKLGMRPEATTTALRNLPLLMTEARKKTGQDLPKDFGAAMSVISGMENPELLELVGRDAFVLAKAFGQNRDAFNQSRKFISSFGPGSDFVGGKLAQAWQDPMYATSQIISSARQGVANAPIQNVEDARLSGPLEEWELRKLGAAREVHPALSWLGHLGVWAESVAPHSDKSNSYLGAGVRTAAGDARAAGNTFLADYLELKFGQESGSYYSAGGQKRFTTKDDAETFRRMRAEMGFGDLSGGEFREYLRLQSADPTAADAYLHKVGRGKGTSRASGQNDMARVGTLLTEAGGLLMQMADPGPKSLRGNAYASPQ